MGEVVDVLGQVAEGHDGLVDVGFYAEQVLGDVVQLVEGEGETGDVLAVNLLGFADGWVDAVVGEELWVFGNRVHDQEPSARGFTVRDDPLGVRHRRRRLIIRLLIIPRHPLNRTSLQNRKSLRQGWHIKVDGLVYHLEFSSPTVGVVVTVAGVLDHWGDFQHDPPGDGLPGGVQAVLGVGGVS